MSNISWLDLGLYLILYSFLGWLAEAFYYAVTKRQFYNRGILSQPLLLSYGITFCLMVLVLPSLGSNHILQFLVTLILFSVVENISDQMMHRISPALEWEEDRSRLFSGTGKGILFSALIAGIYYFIYLVVHPALLVLLMIVSLPVKKIVFWVVFALVLLDFTAVYFAVRKGNTAGIKRRHEKSKQNKAAQWITNSVWKRLNKAYPGIHKMTEDERGIYTFAKGMCLDKLVWVFLVSALLGCVIEFFYCGLVDKEWMNRSSLLYGPFSFVWGMGAVVLTVTLRKLAEKSDRWVFAGGFVIGGVYEYMCSVFTELVFGTVFWDYSDMPLNIGGRTNVLFCFFWGILALVWVKVLYPPLSYGIEKFPAVAGKVTTWVVLFLMVCNSLLTASAMLRYNARPLSPQPANAIEEFLDRQYDDDVIERRWPNMIVTTPAE